MIASIDETEDTSARSSASMKRGEINHANLVHLKNPISDKKVEREASML